MTILFVDSFDHYATADIGAKWRGTTSGSATITTTNARRVNCMSLPNVVVRTYPLPSSTSTLVCGFWLYVSSLSTTFGSAGSVIVRFLESGTHHINICVGSAGEIGAYRGTTGSGTTLAGTSASGAIAGGVGAYVEVKVNIHDTTGSWSIRVNGAQVASGSGQDTRNGGTGVITDVSLVGLTSTSYVDDFYLLNTSGSAPYNDFLGDVRVDCVFPDADGTYADFTPSTGVNHYAVVDEPSVNTTDYNSSGTSGHKDTYGMAAIPTVSGATVYCAAVTIGALKDDAGAVNPYVATIRSNGTNADGATNFAPATSLHMNQTIFETNPDGSVAWTKTTIDAAEFGIKIT